MRMPSILTCLPLWTLVVLGLIFATAPLEGTAFATEGGGGAYPNGAEDFMTGALPPAGTYFLDYASYYSASSFKDRNGRSLLPKFRLDVAVNALRLVHVTDRKILGADWGVHAFLPLAHMDVDATTGRDDRSGMGDVIVDPFILGWHTKNLHVTTGLDFYIPLGNYDRDRLTNTGRNYWTVEPVIAVTYLWDEGFELSGKFMYDYNWENPDTNYRSGQEFHFDYTLGYHVDRNLAVGAGGYCYFQTTDDKLNGNRVGTDGFRGRVMALGPQAAYSFRNMSFAVKWQKEIDARNRPLGYVLWGKFMYAF